MESIHNNTTLCLYCYMLRGSAYNFGPECLAGFNLSVKRNTNALFLAGSTIVFLIAKLRICPVPAGMAPPFLSPPPCWVSVWIALVEPVLLNNTRRATLLFTIIVSRYIIMVYIKIRARLRLRLRLRMRLRV